MSLKRIHTHIVSNPYNNNNNNNNTATADAADVDASDAAATSNDLAASFKNEFKKRKSQNKVIQAYLKTFGERNYVMLEMSHSENTYFLIPTLCEIVNRFFHKRVKSTNRPVRLPNSFMLFRTWFHDSLENHHFKSQEVSMLAKTAWRRSTKEVKDAFKQLYKEAKWEHQRQFPDYKFIKGPKKAKKSQLEPFCDTFIRAFSSSNNSEKQVTPSSNHPYPNFSREHLASSTPSCDLGQTLTNSPYAQFEITYSSVQDLKPDAFQTLCKNQKSLSETRTFPKDYQPFQCLIPFTGQKSQNNLNLVLKEEESDFSSEDNLSLNDPYQSEIKFAAVNYRSGPLISTLPSTLVHIGQSEIPLDLSNQESDSFSKNPLEIFEYRPTRFPFESQELLISEKVAHIPISPISPITPITPTPLEYINVISFPTYKTTFDLRNSLFPDIHFEDNDTSEGLLDSFWV
ncbi:hypothetical protein G9A89_010428 [Geosiphon pyriformis]|nr:hypothetical protein G9A89_010428 [Geosiphon pyriformis]